MARRWLTPKGKGDPEVHEKGDKLCNTLSVRVKNGIILIEGNLEVFRKIIYAFSFSPSKPTSRKHYQNYEKVIAFDYLLWYNL